MRFAPRAFAALCALLACRADCLYAQTHPEKPIRLIVPYPAGGLTDVRARIMGQKAGALLGQPVVGENRPGASTIIGAEVPEIGY